MTLPPEVIALIILLGFLMFLLILSFVRKRYKIFETNVYVIHFSKGRVKRAGLGGSYFLKPIFDKLVTIPTTAQKVDITAEKVISKENQELVINGFVVWKVVDPAKTFSSVRWEQINELIRDISESVIRTTAANMPLIDILREREKIIKAISVELEKIVSDWGIKIITVEIKEVIVVNTELFRNLQAEMFWKEWKKAQELRIKSEMEAGVLEQEKELQVGLREKEKLKKLREKEIEIANLEAEKQRRMIVIKAKAESEKEIIEAEADMKAKKMKAEADAYAEYLSLVKKAEGLRELSQSITDNIIKYELIKNLPQLMASLRGMFQRAVFIGGTGEMTNILGGILGAITGITEAVGSEDIKKLLGSVLPTGEKTEKKEKKKEASKASKS